ncbi:hypothetical protein MIT9_P1640 [Methylomarinovum caldicuralii]|uniref:Citrate transporter-like domain-containing protein n=1 Tax=Methylomarinovum caldicuralii TaxID=438856 RepID=A0AAU9CQ28_9GAMM|nr:sodium:proton antiporter NhaD [Methylomarinovum caldicuralii]BCX82058.1 hypothetical protein MIT9_P1640 [Methylomarinovum caldicuralii]
MSRFFLLLSLCLPSLAWATHEMPPLKMPLVDHPVALACVAIFAFAYVLVMLEDVLELRKSKPILLAAAVIWVLISLLDRHLGILPARARYVLRAELVEYAELFLFLLVATVYVNLLDERGLFKMLCCRIASRRIDYRSLFWMLGWISFLLSTVVNNLTTALIVATVTLMIGRDNPRFIALTCLSAVIASNAGGAFSPFGDITTLMVWQQDKLDFVQFFPLFLPALMNFLVPALCLHWAVPKGVPPYPEVCELGTRRGTWIILALFFTTILIAVVFEQVFELPPYLGMMAGLALLMFYAYHMERRHPDESFDIFHQMRTVEWDTLLFFFGVVFAVGGLRYLGYLALASKKIYTDLGPDIANILVGFLSAVVDNVPVMLAVLQMEPEMDVFQWQLVTLTAGVGGSMLAVGSAAGVAMLGQARAYYTSLLHLRWSPVIVLGYAASIVAHYLLNGS